MIFVHTYIYESDRELPTVIAICRRYGMLFMCVYVWCNYYVTTPDKNGLIYAEYPIHYVAEHVDDSSSLLLIITSGNA